MLFKMTVKCRVCGDPLVTAEVPQAGVQNAITQAAQSAVCPKPGHMYNAALAFSYDEVKAAPPPPPPPIDWKPIATETATAPAPGAELAATQGAVLDGYEIGPDAGHVPSPARERRTDDGTYPLVEEERAKREERLNGLSQVIVGDEQTGTRATTVDRG